MKFASIRDRASVIIGEGLALDLETASSGRFSPDPSAAFAQWEEVRTWLESADRSLAIAFVEADLQLPTPTPRQVFAVGLNYAKHAAEGGYDVPTSPTVFTKFQSCLVGPNVTVNLPADGRTDWEVELVIVIGKQARNVSVADAHDFVAGLTIGQDISERRTQGLGPAPQFSLAKSFEGFGPVGPIVVTLDEVPNPNALELGCSVNGVEMQRSNTADMVFSIAELVSYLSGIVTLYPGDVIFTGTPEGVGVGRNPRIFLNPGDVLESWISGIGKMTQDFR
jgi:2-keto-4-pentenoate hydratase/2-oxohepta-3-ene-1,7-dioic acid hydratase in catechol pathway